MSEAEFKVGDLVTWRSQAGGFPKMKVGKVVAVLGPDQTPRDVLPADQVRGYGFGLLPRGHASYVVDGARAGQKPNLYWPRAASLSMAPLAETARLIMEHAAMRDRLFELEELCVGEGGKPDEPLRWRRSGEPVAEGL